LRYLLALGVNPAEDAHTSGDAEIIFRINVTFQYFRQMLPMYFMGAAGDAVEGLAVPCVDGFLHPFGAAVRC